MNDSPARAALRVVVAALPGGARREGQEAMSAAVEEAIGSRRHLLVQAGTGTGKSLAYLVPAVLSGRRVVVATATKALQEQLLHKDLPLLRKALDVPFTAALLKGRSNYLCRAAVADAVTGAGQQRLLGPGPRGAGRLAEVVAWAATTTSGDRSDLPVALPAAAWSAVSVGVGECPGSSRCPHGDSCFAEEARAAAARADVVVVNLHLYCLHLASGGAVLPEHDVVVVDEAHALEDVAADTLGVAIGPGRLEHVARAARTVFTADHPAAGALDAAAADLAATLVPGAGRRVDPTAGDLAVALVRCAEAAAAAASAARGLDVGGDAGSRRDRLVQLAAGLAGDVRAAGEPGEGRVAWVEAAERGGMGPLLRIAPVDVGGELARLLFATTTAVLTSATLAVGGSFEPVAARLGLDRGAADGSTEGGPADRPTEGGPADVSPWRGLDVGSPFDHERQALLYCAAHLPDPRAPGYEPAMLEELEALVRAAGGRTLALFTSRRAMEAAAAHLGDRLAVEVLVQDAKPRPVLHDAFLSDETSVLLATMGFWQGFDAPGRTCSLVVIDRIPFRSPGDPLAEARRDAATRARRNAFADVDLPHAAVLLAQGAGRLIRGADDRGVVAVLDRRLATASYRWTLVRSLPPMRRSKDPLEARRVLAELAAG